MPSRIKEHGCDTSRTFEADRIGIVERLRARVAEIEHAIYERIQDAVPDVAIGDSPEYQTGVRMAIAAVVEYGLEGIARGPEWSGPIPPAAAAQARRSARVGVSLGAVLRRYVAAHGRLGEFVADETDRGGLSSDGPAIHHLRRTQEVLLEHLTAAIEREYDHEIERTVCSPEKRRAEIAFRLLAGDAVDSADLADLDYELHDSWHVGIAAVGVGAKEAIQGLKKGFGFKLLPLTIEGTACAWLGSPRGPTIADMERIAANGSSDVSLAVGEPARGLDGWCLTHRQARAALGVALRRPERFARYADDRLLAAALQNDTLAESLRRKYLEPLGSQRDGGATSRRTLRAYIDVECNATSAAHVLNVGRRAVNGRVRTAEELIGCTLRECIAELDVALRLEELNCTGAKDNPTR